MLAKIFCRIYFLRAKISFTDDKRYNLSIYTLFDLSYRSYKNLSEKHFLYMNER